MDESFLSGFTVSLEIAMPRCNECGVALPWEIVEHEPDDKIGCRKCGAVMLCEEIEIS